MIRYLTDDEKIRSEVLYREAFQEDKEAFVRYYYSYVTKNNKILVWEQEEEICSMLHLNPYSLSVNGTVVDAYYFVAVATKENCRHQGMMRSLLYKSLKDIHGEGHPFAYLMPANRAIYEPFDFRIVYQQEKVELPIESEAANEKMEKLFDVYTLRDEWYVEKMLEEQRVCENDPPLEIVPYIMMRITHVEKMLSLLRSDRVMRFVLNVQDRIIDENNGVFLWDISCTESICTKVSVQQDDERKQIQPVMTEADWKDGYREISVDISRLTEFVFGKEEIPGLEGIKVLSRICINEAV